MENNFFELAKDITKPMPTCKHGFIQGLCPIATIGEKCE